MNASPTEQDRPDVSMRLELDDAVFELPQATIYALGQIAARYRLDLATTVTQAVANENFLLDLEDQGYRLVIALPDKKMRYLDRV